MDLITALLLVLFGSTAQWELQPFSRLPADTLQLVDPMDPLESSRFVDAVYTDVPAGFIVNTCLVESSCYRPIGMHKGDAWLGRSIWTGVWARNRIAKDCEFYPAPNTVDAQWFKEASVRGNHGLAAGFNIQRLGRCVPLSALDVPLLSAIAAGEKASAACTRMAKRRIKCTADRLRCVWGNRKWRSAKCRTAVRTFHYRVKRDQRIRNDVRWKHTITLKDFRAQAATKQRDTITPAPAEVDTR